MKELFEGVGAAATTLASGKPEAVIWLLLALIAGGAFGIWRGAKMVFSFLEKKETTHKADMEKMADRLFKLAETMQTSNAEIARSLEQMASELRIRGGGRQS